jgi:hypothetical protein
VHVGQLAGVVSLKVILEAGVGLAYGDGRVRGLTKVEEKKAGLA